MRPAVIISYFLISAAIFGYFARMDAKKRLDRLEESATGAASEIADPVHADQEPAAHSGLPVTVMTIEGQPFTWNMQPLPLAEQLLQQSSWLQAGADLVAVDEDLVTEYQQHGHRTPYPSQRNDTLNARGSLFVERADDGVSVVRQWDANTGNMETVLMLQGVETGQCLESSRGVFCLVRPNSSPDPRTDNVVFLDGDGHSALAALTVTRDNPRLALLPDNSVLIVGGSDALSGQHVNSVERVRARPTQLEIERLPDIPGPRRWGYASVVLRDGRFVVAGGTSAQDKGCQAPACSDQTFVLDADTGLWTEGPALNEPRASATASLLADNSVIVAGGLTSDRAGNARPSRSTERLWPGEPRFLPDAPLPFAMAEHRALEPINDAAASVLLLDDGGKSVIAYDLAQGEWRVVGGFSTFTTFKLGPFSNGQEHFFWVSDSREDEWSRQAIRIRGYRPASTLANAATVHLYRGGTGVVAGETGVPAVIAGGYISSTYRLTAAVDSYLDAEGLQALSPLTFSRYDAQVFRLRGAAIAVAGGVSINRDTRDPDLLTPPIELLRSVSTREKWQTLDIKHPRGTRYAQLADNVLVALVPGRRVERLVVDTSGDEGPRIHREQLPDLPVERESGTEPDERVVARGLPDGRLIVAGGLTFDKRIAIYQDSPEADDEYVGIGGLVPARTYEIFDPASRQWITSARTSERGGQVALTDDGRVVKLRINPAGRDDRGEPDFTFLFEVSHADEREWRPLPMRQPPYMEAGSTRLLSVGNELFVAGFSEATKGSERKRVLWWLDGERRAWETVWAERESSLDSRHQDVIARVSLSTGRELLVPVGGN